MTQMDADERRFESMQPGYSFHPSLSASICVICG